jgi:hypothetical protein
MMRARAAVVVAKAVAPVLADSGFAAVAVTRVARRIVDL